MQKARLWGFGGLPVFFHNKSPQHSRVAVQASLEGLHGRWSRPCLLRPRVTGSGHQACNLRRLLSLLFDYRRTLADWRAVLLPRHSVEDIGGETVLSGAGFGRIPLWEAVFAAKLEVAVGVLMRAMLSGRRVFTSRLTQACHRLRHEWHSPTTFWD